MVMTGLLGVVFLSYGWMIKGEVRKFAFYADRVEFAKLKGAGKMVAEESWAAGQVRGVRSSPSGAVNGKPRYRVDLLVGHKVALAWFLPEEVASELVAWVQWWIDARRPANDCPEEQERA
jgi:hypothetical protein